MPGHARRSAGVESRTIGCDNEPVMNVRPATVEDLATIVDFIAQEAREAEGRELDQETLAAGVGAGLGDESIARYWLLVDDADTPAGCTSVIREWSDWQAGYYWWIQSMYIAPQFRGRGHLDDLLAAVTDAAGREQALELRLYVHTANTAAVRAYEKSGFEQSDYAIMSRALPRGAE